MVEGACSLTENEQAPSLLVECKYQKRPISIKVVQEFAQKRQELKTEIPNHVPFNGIYGKQSDID